ncbi:MAG: hypothetical protein K0V04_29215 [Deltaproteobacteria bacterium]|nr:hypothetical protein [Deltaproteobacteria bacterium]
MKFSSRIPLRPVMSLLLVGAAMAQTACDVDSDTTLRMAPTADLSQFGVDGIETAPGRDHAYTLLDGDAQEIGRIDLDQQGELTTVAVELNGTHTQMQWAPGATEITLQCEGALATDVSPTEPCMTSMLAASVVAEADGLDVPNYEAPAELLYPDEFRKTCETISTWAGNCQSCYSAAYNASQYSHHAGGSCNQGGVYATCVHEFCSDSGGGIAPELPTNF